MVAVTYGVAASLLPKVRNTHHPQHCARAILPSSWTLWWSRACSPFIAKLRGTHICYRAGSMNKPDR